MLLTYKRLAWFFQDLINTLFHYFPDLNYLVPCTSNVRLDYCLPDNVDDACRQFSTLAAQASSSNDDYVIGANDVLPLMVHGSRGAFHENWKLWDKTFFTTYFPNMVNWFVVKNIRLLEYAAMVQPVMENQKLFKLAFNVFLDFDMESDDDVGDLKRRLSAAFGEMTTDDVCFDVKDVLVAAIKTK